MAEKAKKERVTDPAEKFRKLAQYRTAKAIRYIRALSFLSNTTAYKYTPEQVNKILTGLKAEISAVQETFQHGGKSTSTFTL